MKKEEFINNKNQNVVKEENMQSFLDLAKKRKTSYEFTDQKVRDSDIKKILEAGRWAPSTHNEQPWSFMIVKNQKTILKLMDICYYSHYHTDPAAIIAIVLEPLSESKQKLSTGIFKDLTKYHEYLNIAMPTLNMVYEAEDLGISSCMLSPLIQHANKILKVPKKSKTVLLVGLGYEKKGAFQKQRERKNLNQITFNETYGNKHKL